METLLFLKAYWKWIIAFIILCLVIYGIYKFWQRLTATTIRVTDANGNTVDLTNEQVNEATAIATRLHDDLNSGWFFGLNTTGFGLVDTRDREAYEKFAAMSDTMFAATCQKYQEKYKSSVIAEIRNEDSLMFSAQVDVILAKATKLSIN